MTDLVDEITAAIRHVVGRGGASLHEPRLLGNEGRYVQECIDSTFVSSVGRFVDIFEDELAAYTGAGHAVAVVNGTAALHTALVLAGVEPDDEVIVPALTFVATANAVRYCGAIPHFVDSEQTTLGMDATAVRQWLEQATEQQDSVCINRQTNRRVRAMVPMHTFGHPCNLDSLLAVSREYGLVMIEDAAESIGSTYRGYHTGTFGHLAILSFNGNKTITTGGGGAILTRDPSMAEHAKHLTTTAREPHGYAYVHDEVGFNYRLPNLNAALGCAQLEQLPEFLASKRRLYERYQAAFDQLTRVRLVAEPDGCRSNYWLQALILEEEDPALQTAILEQTNEEGLMTRPVWTPMHWLRPYQACPRAPLPVAESLARRLINLPSSAGLA